MTKNSTQALLWLCWQRTRYAIGLELLAATGFGILFLVYFGQNETDIIRSNAITLTALIGAWLLNLVLSSALAKSGTTQMGYGFPLRAEFHFPVTSFQLTAVPLFYCVLTCYVCFLLPALVLATAFGLSMPPALVHFMFLEYLFLVLAMSWFSNHGPESIIATIIFILCFYFELIIPDFSLDSETSRFEAGSWSSTLMPTLIVAASLIALFIGVSKQRSGENFVFKSGRNQSIVESLSAIYWFRFIATACPTTSARGAFVWRVRQSRGLQAGIGMGMVMGVIVVLVLYLLQLREYADADYTLDEVSAFVIIAFCTVFSAALVSMFGLSFKNGAAKFSVFDRTLPLSTAQIVTLRIGITFLCLLVAGVSELISIGVLGPLFIENFDSVRVEFFDSIRSITERGFVYAAMRTVLFFCFVYIAAVLWGVWVSWFSKQTRLLSIICSGLMIYGMLMVAVLIALDTDGQTFLRMSRSLRDFHLWIIMAAMVGSIFYFFNKLLRDEVITAPQVIALCAIGFVLAVIQTVMINIDGGSDGVLELTPRIWDQMKGLLPLFATVLALWTQQKLRHE